MSKKISIIGGGHIGLAFAEGLINSGRFSTNQIVVTDPSVPKISRLKKMGIDATIDNKYAAKEAQFIFIAVKPMIVKSVLDEIKNVVDNKVIISLAAAVSIGVLRKELSNSGTTIGRIMPNLPISCNRGVIGLFTNKISEKDKSQLLTILETLGLVISVEKEKDLDTLTLLSACGPAVVCSFMEMMKKCATKRLGLTKATAEKLVEQTFKGSLAYLEKSDISPAKLIKSVATKGGVTESILLSMDENNLYSGFVESMNAGSIKIKRLAKDFGN